MRTVGFRQYRADRRKDHAAVQQVSGILFSGTGAEHVLSDGEKTRIIWSCSTRTLRRFDEYLWKTRDSDRGRLSGDIGVNTIPEGQCDAVYGCAGCMGGDAAKGCEAVPIASMDVMSYSYSCRSVLAEICRIAGKRGRGGEMGREKPYRCSGR